MKKGITLVLIACLLFGFALTGCGQNSVEDENSKKDIGITITDMLGKDINLDNPAQKVVVLSPADCEIIYALSAEDILVGRGEYCDYPKEVNDIPKVQSGENTNIEQIISLQPDVVILSTMAQTEEQIASLEDAGIKVIATDVDNIEEVYESIDMISKVVGKEEAGQDVIKQMKNTFADIEKKVRAKNVEKKTVYFEVTPLKHGLWTAGKNTFMDEIAKMLNLENIFADVNSWGEISQEQVIERNPDYIITTTMYSGEDTTVCDEIYSRDGWNNIKALVNKQVYNVNSDAISRPGPRLADATVELYNYVYGEE